MPLDIHEERILILDFGSQYTQLIARRIRQAGVYCEIHPFNMDEQAIKSFAPKAIILSGGPETVTASNTPRVPSVVFKAGCPVLGICYGMQVMAQQLGGHVTSAVKNEFGYARVRVDTPCRLLQQIRDHTENDGSSSLDVWMSHGDKVTALPPGFTCSASTSSCPIAAMANDKHQFYGLQFHPEVTHTKQGYHIIERFVTDIAGCKKLWTAQNIIDDAINNIRDQVGSNKVLLGLSGGVDSSVVAALIHKAIGHQLTCVFVDNGLLRLNEADQVKQMFADNIGINLIQVNAEDNFLQRLTDVDDPEKKRKIIGETFIEVFDETAERRGDIKFLAQGTIYPDIIESAASTTGKAHVIKSHHNVGGLPKTMKMQLVEPLKELFKDEVRSIGIALGLPDEIVYRHPFPGPGLGVRIPGKVTKAYTSILRQADAIFIDELRQAGWYEKVSQAFAVFLPVKSVGVVGDKRRYAYVVSLRAVETVDFMTARWAHLPYDLLATISARIINEIDQVSRVTYDISDKPPATIEWE
ncbi:MAG: glutamine-hydrolyzing GMP synthase [Endozoicomonadaceae bacterium]|nr:glutamine-hydrolyzing GMP synthase [Endozoicomonadaceae bacterium]